MPSPVVPHQPRPLGLAITTDNRVERFALSSSLSIWLRKTCCKRVSSRVQPIFQAASKIPRKSELDGFLGMKIWNIPKCIGFPAFPYPLFLCQVCLGTFKRVSTCLGFISVQRHKGGCQGFNTLLQSGARDARFQAEETANLPSHAWQEPGVQSMSPAPCSQWQPGFDYSQSRRSRHEAVTMGECARLGVRNHLLYFLFFCHLAV